MALQQRVEQARIRSRSRDPEAGEIPPYNANQAPNPEEVHIDVDPFAGVPVRETLSGARIQSTKPAKMVKESTTRFEWFAIVAQLVLFLSSLIGYIVTGLKKDESGQLINSDMNQTLYSLMMIFIGLLGGNGANLGISRYMHSQQKNVLRKNGLIAPQ